MKINRYLFAAQYVAGKTVLDIGCATGYGSALLKERGANEVVGGDVSTQALDVACKRYKQPGLDFRKLDAQELPFADASFDVVVSFELIEHLPSYEDFVAECWRLLRDDGILICSTPNKAAVSPDSKGTYRLHHFHEFYADELTELLSGHFTQVSLFGCVPFLKKEKLRDDFLYNLALRIAPRIPVRHLIAFSKITNLVTWLPFLRNYKLIRVEEIKDWDSLYVPRFKPYPLAADSPVSLGLVAVAGKNRAEERRQ